MHLELHDNEEGNSLLGKQHNIDFDYQAEMEVQDCANTEVLGTVVRSEWTREGQGFRLTETSNRFLGEWKKGFLYERQHGTNGAV